MCGFIGEISNNFIKNEDIKIANEFLVCRGPDSTTNIQGGIKNYHYSFIFNRLAIIDLSKQADQPMISKDKNFVLMFNGEIYNHKVLRKTLEKKIEFSTDHSDSEVVLNGLILHGLDYLKELRGQFSIFFLNKLENKAYLIRDRIGQKPLYYNITKNRLVFSSNLNSITSLSSDLKINYKNLAQYFKYGVIGKNNTLFENFYKLQPAEVIKFHFTNSEIKFEKEFFWNIEKFLDYKKFNKSEFFNILNESINLRADADVPIANFLSGGIDSTSIVKNMHSNDKIVNTFSVNFDNQKYDESKWAYYVSKKYNTNHQSINFNSTIDDLFIDNILESLDEPYYDPSVLPSFILSKEISKYFKVAISGDGGDELLGGYIRTNKSLKNVNYFQKFLPKFYNLFPSFLGTGNLFLSNSSDIEIRYKSFLEDLKLLKMLGINYSDTEELITLNNEADSYKALLLSDYKFYLPDMMMFKVDRTSMFNSLEIRSPFVDHNLIEYVISRDTSYFDKNNSKSLLKEYLSEDFDSKFLNRNKQGFVFDIENWVYKNFDSINYKLNTGVISNFIPQNFSKKFLIYKSRINAHRIWKMYVLNNYLNRFKTF